MESSVQNMFWNVPTGSYVLWDEQLPTNVPDVYEHDFG